MILLDFNCDACEHLFEALTASDAQTEPCPECGNPFASRQISAPRIGLYADGASTVTREALKERSRAHSLAEAKKEPERIAGLAGGVAKAGPTWNQRSRKTSSKGTGNSGN